METVKLSPKYQIVIPKKIRESMGLQPGQRLQVMEYDGRIQIIPVRPIKQMRGAFKGMNTDVEREPDRF